MSFSKRMAHLLPPPVIAPIPSVAPPRRFAPPPRATMVFSSEPPPQEPLPGSGGAPLSRFLLLDIETTGLSRGTGTLVFLVACGRMRPEGRVEVRLGLMRDPGEEGDLLAWLVEELDSADGVITYNGASFDLPLLRTRFALRRLPDPFAGKVHVDLLPLCRRVFGKPARLVDIEERVLGITRPGDVGGAEVARRYLGYLRSGDGRTLGAVVRHCATDVAALGRIAARLGGPRLTPLQRAELAHALVRSGEPHRALALARRTLCMRPGRTTAIRALWCMASAARRLGDRTNESRACESILALDPGDRRARRVVAIHLEHRVRDLQEARTHAVVLASDDIPDEDAGRRLARIEGKLRRGRNQV